MAGSAEVPPSEIDDIINQFEKDTTWKVSPEARTILASAMHAIMVDDIGLGDRTGSLDRRETYNNSVNNLRVFLDKTAELAERQKAKFYTDSDVIGGVVVLQNMQTWRSLLGCGCWPRDQQ